jgi:hypothetical protein
MPEWRDGAAVTGAWRVSIADDHLVLTAAGSPAGAAVRTPREPRVVDALRALARAAWECPEWTAIRADGTAADRALTALGLARDTGWAVPAAQ